MSLKQTKLQNEEALQKLFAIEQIFEQNHDNERVERVIQLGKKMIKNEWAVAFCGHFSAGKSSMINELLGDQILPSSPIPTSANLVKVKAGDKDYLKVTLKEGKSLLYPAPYDYEAVKEFFKDGNEIESIELSRTNTNLSPNVVIMDTPGIDSTDDAHRIATESALHLADMVFYVMDYNHVQSELNFLFTKELMNANKEVYLIINQIDKHQQTELSFESFKDGVRDAFLSWQVYPKDIFYTSLREKDHPENNLQEVKELIYQSINRKSSTEEKSIEFSMQMLITQHLNELNERTQVEKEKWKSILEQFSVDDLKQMDHSYQKLQTKREDMLQEIEHFEQVYTEEMENIYKNAYLMPFETRELAKAFLEASQSDFKVGLFFTKQKTENEKQSRTKRFLDDLQEKIQSQLVWHMKELLQKYLKQWNLVHPELVHKAQHLTIAISDSLLQSSVKVGAKLTGDYVLNYTDELAQAIKREARKVGLAILNELKIILKEKQTSKLDQLEIEIRELDYFIQAKDALTQIDLEVEANASKLNEIVNGRIMTEIDSAFISLLESEGEIEIMDSSKLTIMKDKERQTHSSAHQTISDAPISPIEVSNRINQAVEILQPINGFKKYVEDLKVKGNRLANKAFTVALFGAFSAGKSSFANALMGEKVLPVSPNPTTATINKIVPPTAEYPHGTAVIKLKNEQQMFQDVLHSLEVFNRNVNNIKEAILQIRQLLNLEREFEPKEKPHIAFLAAFIQGYTAIENKLGSIVQTNISEFQEYVANEQKSCFVEWIELYYDCPLTQKGIALVDTPGADSINARHTGVAFDYIKNSDAILFVTYYNHAFSKADREFLIQLGRVKDTFELDKMFFIVNAVDLATSQEEVNDVLFYVEDQLVQYGVRHPNLFPISSQLALKEKKNEVSIDSGLSVFEKRFYHFIEHDLMSLSIESAQRDIQRGIERLNQLIHSSEEDADTKKQRKLQLETEWKQISHSLSANIFPLLSDRVQGELDELVFYIKQRIFLRFPDFFKESFNPAVLRNDSPSIKLALQSSLKELLSSISFDLAQELRASSLRIEKYIGKIIMEQYQYFKEEFSGLNDSLSYSDFEMPIIAVPDIIEIFPSLDLSSFNKSLGYYKNAKSFFEKNEKKWMAEEIQAQLQEPVNQYLSLEKNKMIEYYLNELNICIQKLTNQLESETNEIFNALFDSLTEVYNRDELNNIKWKLMSLT